MTGEGMKWSQLIATLQLHAGIMFLLYLIKSFYKNNINWLYIMYKYNEH